MKPWSSIPRQPACLLVPVHTSDAWQRSTTRTGQPACLLIPQSGCSAVSKENSRDRQYYELAVQGSHITTPYTLPFPRYHGAGSFQPPGSKSERHAEMGNYLSSTSPTHDSVCGSGSVNLVGQLAELIDEAIMQAKRNKRERLRNMVHGMTLWPEKWVMNRNELAACSFQDSKTGRGGEERRGAREKRRIEGRHGV